MSEHLSWLKAQRMAGTPEEESTASAFAVEKLRVALQGVAVPERDLHRAASAVEKEAAKISEKHSGRAAMLHALGKEFYIKQVPFHVAEHEETPEPVHHPDSDHAQRSHG